MNQDTTLYFSSINFNSYHDEFWNSLYDECDEGGKFFINIAKRINPCRFVSRNGEYSLPWKQEVIPGYEMPVYDPTFNKTFEEVSNARAMEIATRIDSGEKFAVMYSGGIDSTVVMTALLRNLTKAQLEQIVVCASSHTITEHPTFWVKHILGKFTVLDSTANKYDDLIEAGYTPITADEGDCIFGTVFGLSMYTNYDTYVSEISDPTVRQNLMAIKHRVSDPEVHYSKYRDLIIRHFGISSQFGNMFYDKIVHNIQTATVPVHSLHDFFWWIIFNIKYLNCAVRGAIYYNDRIEWKDCIYRIFNWYSGEDYQRWSMVNNNNGQKINKTLATYKTAAKDYIWLYDKNDWYRNFKTKIDSLWNITTIQAVDNSIDLRPVSRAGLTKDFEMMYLSDPSVKEFYRQSLLNYKINW